MFKRSFVFLLFFVGSLLSQAYAQTSAPTITQVRPFNFVNTMTGFLIEGTNLENAQLLINGVVQSSVVLTNNSTTQLFGYTIDPLVTPCVSSFEVSVQTSAGISNTIDVGMICSDFENLSMQGFIINMKYTEITELIFGTAASNFTAPSSSTILSADAAITLVLNPYSAIEQEYAELGSTQSPFLVYSSPGNTANYPGTGFSTYYILLIYSSEFPIDPIYTLTFASNESFRGTVNDQVVLTLGLGINPASDPIVATLSIASKVIPTL